MGKGVVGTYTKQKTKISSGNSFGRERKHLDLILESNSKKRYIGWKIEMEKERGTVN